MTQLMCLLIFVLFFISSCGSAPTDTSQKNLPTKVTNNINQNLVNGRVPAPSEVANWEVPVAENACDKFKKNIPKDWQSGYISVLENPGDVNSRYINIFYYGKTRNDVTPVAFFNGGPGADSHSSFYMLRNMQKSFDPEGLISFIFIDQRGTGCSDPYPTGDSFDILKRLSYYGSRGISADAEEIRKRLVGSKSWIIFGQSYGAFIVHRYITMYPKSVKAAFAHAGVLNEDPVARLTDRIYSQHRIMKEFLATYPDDTGIIEVLSKKLTLDVCFEDARNNRNVCGYEIIAFLPKVLLGFHDYWIVIHQWLNMMVKDNELNNKGIALFLVTFVFSQQSIVSSGWAEHVIGWVDRNIRPFDATLCQEIKVRLKNDNIDINNAFNECSVMLQLSEKSQQKNYENPVEKLHQDRMKLEFFKNILMNNPRLDFYLYSGLKDSFVPVEIFKEEVDVLSPLSNFHYKEFTGTGHEGYCTEPKVWLDILGKIN